MSSLDKFCIITTLMCLFSMGMLACAIPDEAPAHKPVKLASIDDCAGDFVCELQYVKTKK